MATIPGLSVTPAAWWRADDRETLEIDADGGVRKWLDRSGNGRTLFTSDTSANRRLKYTAADARVGGRPSVSATAANQLLQTATEAANGTPTSYQIEVREIYAVTMYSTGTQTQFNIANNNAGWGRPAGENNGDGYSTLVGGVVNGATGGNPRFMGNLNTGRVIGTNALAVDGAYKNRDTFPSGSGDTSKPVTLPLPLSLLRIAVTSTAITAARIIGNMDTGASRAWSGPILEIVMFDQPLSEADRKIMQDYALYGYGIEQAPSPPIAGTLARTLGALTAASAGRLALRGSLVRSLSALSTVSAAKLDLRGRGTGALRPATLASTGRLSARGAGAIVLGALTLVARSPSQGRGEASITLRDATASAVGRSHRRGVAALRLGDLSTISAGETRANAEGRVSGQLGGLQLRATGIVRTRGVLAVALASLEAIIVARLSIAGRLVASLADLVAVGVAATRAAYRTPAVRIAKVAAETRRARMPTERRLVRVTATGTEPMKMPDKDPNDVLDYAIDWSGWLGDDTITSVEWISADGLPVDKAVLAGSTATAWLSGGTVGRSCRVTCRIQTAAGRQCDQSLRIFVTER